MSGITPILDTLLHQVLGRRDGPVGRPLPDQLIAPPRAGLPPQSTHSDSRLDPHPLPTARTAVGSGDKVDAGARRRSETPSPTTQGGAATTRLSVAARTIARVLARFPASPSTIRAQAPLVIAPERLNVARLAAQLRDSIATSGLFYEAHLLRWRNGTLPLAQLLREPQMLWSARTPLTAQPPSPAATPSQGSAPASTAASPAAGQGSAAHANSVAGGAAPASTNATAGMPQTYGADGKPVSNLPAVVGGDPGRATALAGGLLPALAGNDRVVHPALEGVLRHQLEMLAAPILRWEGAPWAGVFMALTLQPPPHFPEQHPRDGNPSRHGGEAPWQTHLSLRLGRLGEVDIDLRLGAQHVALELQAEADVVERMNAARDGLRERLVGLGFQSVALDIRAHDRDGAGHD